MQCPSCGKQTLEGKFCTNCGTQLAQEQLYNDGESSEGDDTAQIHENAYSKTVEKVKTAGSDFGHFFVTLLKKPSEARKANRSDLSSGIIAIVLFAILIAISYHVILRAMPAGFFMNVSFFDSFILPLISFSLMQLLIAGLVYAGARLSLQTVTFTDVIAKYGAYAIPFALLYATGMIFSLMGISALAAILLLISLFGLLFITPSFILMEQYSEGFDRIYVLIALYIIVALITGFFAQSFLESILGTMMDSMFRGY